jgi:DNA-binding NtrC family response regulator
MLMGNATRSAPSPYKAKNPLTGLRILLAEDEGLVALELERILGDFGCEVVGPVAGVEQVLQKAAAGRFDGALLDVNLRGRQIFEVIPQLQKLGLKLIITSGYNDASLFPAAYRTIPRIAKPFDEKQLRRVCEDVFANPATQRPNQAS